MSKLSLAIVLVAACQGNGSRLDNGSAGPAGSAVARRSCATWGQADIDAIGKQIKEYAKGAIIAYHYELQNQHLDPLKIARVEEVVPAGATPPTGPTITNEKGTFIVGPTYVTNNKVPPELDVVIDSGAKVYTVKRDPAFTNEPYFTCECVPQECPPKAGETHQVLYGPLEPGQTFAGSVTIHYPERHLEPQYADLKMKCGC